MSFNFWDDDLYCWQQIIGQLQEIQGQEEEAPSYCQMSENAWILILEGKDNMTKVVRDWIYPVAPTSYYAHSGVLGVDQYDLVEVKDNKAYYKYIGISDKFKVEDEKK